MFFLPVPNVLADSPMYLSLQSSVLHSKQCIALLFCCMGPLSLEDI